MKDNRQKANRSYKKWFNITDCYELLLPLRWAEYIISTVPKRRTISNKFEPVPSRVIIKIKIKTPKTNIESEGDFMRRDASQYYKTLLEYLETTSQSNNDTSAKRQKA